MTARPVSCLAMGRGMRLSTGQGKGIVSEYLHARGEFGNLMSVAAHTHEPLNQKKNDAGPACGDAWPGTFKVAVNSMAEAVQVAVKKRA